MDAISVTVRRGGVVEATHRVHVATTDGETRGDPNLRFLLRSSCKPLQAIPFVDGYAELDDDEIAIACASHHAEPEQLAAARKVLARAGATVDDLENGLQPGRPDGKLGHNCSGKHAGMLAACRANGWPTAGYRLPEHPLQSRLSRAVCSALPAVSAPDSSRSARASLAARDEAWLANRRTARGRKRRGTAPASGA